MYGKIFEEIFGSSIMIHGGDTVYVFIAMIVLSDSEGYIREHPAALANRIGKDLQTVRAAITNLETPDPESASQDHEGRRIIPISTITNGAESRGWFVVNKKKYREIYGHSDRKNYMRGYMRDYRNNKEKQEKDCKQSVNKKVNSKQVVNKKSPVVSNVSLYTNTYTNTDITTLSGSSPTLHEQAKQILTELNLRTLRKPPRGFQPVKANITFVEQRLRETSYQTVLEVTSRMILQWWKTDLQEYLRPATLYNATKFAQYVGYLGTPLSRDDGKKPKEVFDPGHLAAVMAGCESVYEQIEVKPRPSLCTTPGCGQPWVVDGKCRACYEQFTGGRS